MLNFGSFSITRFFNYKANIFFFSWNIGMVMIPKITSLWLAFGLIYPSAPRGSPPTTELFNGGRFWQQLSDLIGFAHDETV